MRVLHVFKTYFPETIGGIEQTINQIIKGTSPLGVTSEVLTFSPNPTNGIVDVDGHFVHYCKTNFEISSTPFSSSAFYHFRQLAKNADLIHYHFPYPFLDLLHLTSKLNKPTLVTYHSDIVKQKYLLRLYRPLKSKFLSSVSHIVATSPNYFKTSKVLSKFKNKVSVIPIGLDDKDYPVPSEDRLMNWKNRFGDKFFLFVGVLRYYKGLHILIEAAKNASYPIVIVGAGPVEKELKDQVEKLKINNIHFLGYLASDDKYALLFLCYAVIFPSHLRSEAFGISLLEGAIYGKPLISSEIGTGTSFININNETGIVVPPSDSVALASAMDYLWNNVDSALKMGQSARQRYEELFTVEKMASSYVDIYKKLLGESG